MASDQKTFVFVDVSKHNKTQDYWVIISGIPESDTKVIATIYGPKAGTRKNENPEKAGIEVIWKPKNGQSGKPEEYEMVLKTTLQSICPLTGHPNTTSIIIQSQDKSNSRSFSFCGPFNSASKSSPHATKRTELGTTQSEQQQSVLLWASRCL